MQEKEEWKDVPGYEGRYQVSIFGQVKSYDMMVKSVYGSSRKMKGRIRKQHVANSGYKFVMLYKDTKPSTQYLHRLVALTFIPKVNGKEYVNHKDGNKLNNHVDNLEWCDCFENMRHAVES